ncbi:MAG: phosphoribosyltransferase family protein [Oscillospiraceae bacterium]
MEEFYTLKVAGLERKLVICPVNEKMSIAGFIMFSDVELTINCAKELLKKVPEFDIIITAESKGIPLAYEMARQSGKNYILARKSQKLYMKKPVAVDVKSITTTKVQTLYLDECDMKNLQGKKVLIVDDVISTGESLAALEQLVIKSSGNIIGKATVLAEGDAAKRDDIIFLEPLPLFFKD